VKPPIMPDVIAPLDAFRLMLAARYGGTALDFAEIKSRAWFLWPHIPHADAESTLKLLCDHIREGNIRLRGELKASDPPFDIDRADCLIGELNIFQQTLTIYRGRTPARIYRHVFCVKDDVMKIVECISKNRSGHKHEPTLKYATPSMIRNVITSVYDDADKGKPRPNINQLPDAVLQRLEMIGFKASGNQIKKIGREEQFKSRRHPVGKRLT
jgi:hypothetical protein